MFHSILARNRIPFYSSTTAVDEPQITTDDAILCGTTATRLIGSYLPELDRSNSMLASNLPVFVPLPIRAKLEKAYKKCVTDIVSQSGGSITEFLIHRSACY